MQQADITSIIRELAGLVAERYVFPGLAAEISEHLERRLAEGGYAAVPDEESLAAAVTGDLQSQRRQAPAASAQRHRVAGTRR
jgi:N-terminal domain of Peptidase_S41 in eukaryotic IRBP